MTDVEMTPHEILNAIAADLTSDAHDFWAGMSHGDRNEMVIDVQRGESTIEEAQTTISVWAKFAEAV